MTTYSDRYVDVSAVAAHQLRLLARWGAPVPAGSSVLELGCADGFSTAHLAEAGYDVTAVDTSEDMLAGAKQRLADRGLHASLVRASVQNFESDREFDVGLGLMRTFFAYGDDPVPALRKLAECIRVKVLVDVNPRNYPIQRAVDAVREAGFVAVTWRPFLVPQTVRVPALGLPALRAAERVPGIRSIPLRRKFNVVVKGEKRSIPA